MKTEKESILCAVQEQAIRTNYVKHRIDKPAQSPLYKMSDKKIETIYHIASKCKNLTQRSTGEGTIMLQE